MRSRPTGPFLLKVAATLLIAVAVCLFGCGPSSDERRRQQDAERESAQKQAQQKTLDHVSKLRGKFGAIDFPGEKLSEEAFSYDVQNFFAQAAGKPVIFLAHVEDVEAAQHDVVVQFSRRIGSPIFQTGLILDFRLHATAGDARVILSHPRSSGLLKGLRDLNLGDWVVVAKVERVEKAKRYEVRGSGNTGEQADLNVEASPKLIAEGVLVAAEPLSDTN